MLFDTARQTLEEITGTDLKIVNTSSDRSTRGDIEKVAYLENIGDENQTRYDTRQTTIRIENEDGEIYAEVIIHELENAALLDWVEVIDAECRGHGVGRSLHEDAVKYIDQKLNAERIYTKIENPQMVSVNLDTGFKQVEEDVNGNWYVRN